MYYKKLINRYNLIKFWIFFGNNFNMVFKINFKNLNCIYKCNYFLDFRYIFLNIKKIVPLIINTSKKQKNFLFLFNKSLYSQTGPVQCRGYLVIRVYYNLFFFNTVFPNRFFASLIFSMHTYRNKFEKIMCIKTSLDSFYLYIIHSYFLRLHKALYF